MSASPVVVHPAPTLGAGEAKPKRLHGPADTGGLAPAAGGQGTEQEVVDERAARVELLRGADASPAARFAAAVVAVRTAAATVAAT